MNADQPHGAELNPIKIGRRSLNKRSCSMQVWDRLDFYTEEEDERSEAKLLG